MNAPRSTEIVANVREAISSVYGDPNLPDEDREALLAEATEKVLALMARAWDEGFDAGERDAFEHVTFNEPCIPNPYRVIPPVQPRPEETP